MIWLSWVFATFAFEPQGVIMTVRGPIAPSEFGMVLVHEHVMCDFAGADKTGRHRYDPEEVIATMLPYLRFVKERGFSGFVDATPAYIGLDPLVLKRLSELTGLHILTNTGYYGAAGDKFLPPHAFSETADQLAERWVAEWRNGIEGTGIKPGFIKIGVDPGPLSEIDRKLVVAVARTHLQTGLTIACHTGEARAALEVLEVVKSEGIDPSALIIVHADGVPDQSVHEKLAKEGAWVEYDAIGAKPINEHVRLILEMVRKGFADKLLLSHDAGWYWVGEPNGGKEKIRPYTALSDELVPALKKCRAD
jgi:phosphotriesterase-related protein